MAASEVRLGSSEWGERGPLDWVDGAGDQRTFETLSYSLVGWWEGDVPVGGWEACSEACVGALEGVVFPSSWVAA